MKNINRDYEKYLIFLMILFVLTILLSFLSLNRLAKLPFDFIFRNLIEHFLSGFYVPPAITIIIFIFSFLIGLLSWFFNLLLKIIPKYSYIPIRDYFKEEFKVINLLWEKIILLITTAIYIIFEIWFQFINKYNNGSLPQTIASLCGILLFWVIYKKFILNE